MTKAENRTAAKAYQQEKEWRWREEVRASAVAADPEELRKLGTTWSSTPRRASRSKTWSMRSTITLRSLPVIVARFTSKTTASDDSGSLSFLGSAGSPGLVRHHIRWRSRKYPAPGRVLDRQRLGQISDPGLRAINEGFWHRGSGSRLHKITIGFDLAEPMKDYQASVEKLRKDAAENKLIADLATNKAKRETFAKLADHLNTLADEVERAMAAREIEEDR
jgi:hypothetical protein